MCINVPLERGVQQRQTNEEEKVLLRRQVQELFNEKYSEY